MSLLSLLFGGSPDPKSESEPEIYEGFKIFVEPVKEGGSFRVCARIEKEIGGEVKTHRMIRADTCESAQMAQEMTARKAKALIDQQGDALFN